MTLKLRIWFGLAGISWALAVGGNDYSAIVSTAAASEQRGDGSAAMSIVVRDAWIRLPPPLARTAAGYLTISNPGDKSDTLLSIQSATLPDASLHISFAKDGVAGMRPLEAGFNIGSGATETLSPGGVHIMFTAPSQPLTVGQLIPAVLVFERAGPVPVVFKVEPKTFAPSTALRHPER